VISIGDKYNQQQHTTTVLRPFVRDYPGELVPEETLTHPPSWSLSNLYQLLPSTTIHSILLVQIMCLAIFLHNLSPCRLWSTSWSGAHWWQMPNWKSSPLTNTRMLGMNADFSNSWEDAVALALIGGLQLVCWSGVQVCITQLRGLVWHSLQHRDNTLRQLTKITNTFHRIGSTE